MDFNIEEVENRFTKYSKNGIYLTGEQIDTLEKYNINYSKCKSINELINLIEQYKDDNNYD